MRTRNIISELYEIDLVDNGTRRVAKYPDTLGSAWGHGSDDYQYSVKHIPTYVLSITTEGYEKMKRDLEEFHNMLEWMNDNPETQISYGMWDTVRLLKL
jgi:hypothetical protein